MVVLEQIIQLFICFSFMLCFFIIVTKVLTLNRGEVDVGSVSVGSVRYGREA